MDLRQNYDLLERASPCFDDEDQTLSQRKFMQPTFPMTLEEDKKSRVTVKISKVSDKQESQELSYVGDDSNNILNVNSCMTQRNLYKKMELAQSQNVSQKQL